MSSEAAKPTVEEMAPRPDDRIPVDGLVGEHKPPAVAADGEIVANGELEAAAELVRVARRLGLSGHGVDGFGIYRTYRALVGRLR
jgi:hypothetical protein